MLLLDRLLKRLVRDGELVVTAANRRVYRYGRPHPRLARVAIHFTDAMTPHRIAFNPALAAAEAFMDGRLQFTEGGIADLLDLVRMEAHGVVWRALVAPRSALGEHVDVEIHAWGAFSFPV